MTQPIMNPALVVGSLVRPRGALKSVALWRGRRDGQRVLFTDDVMGYLADGPGVVMEVVNDKAMVMTQEVFGWTYSGNLTEVGK